MIRDLITSGLLVISMNYKDIGSLYLVFGGISGLAGVGLSILTRLE